MLIMFIIISYFIIAIVSPHKALPHLSASKHKQKNSFFILNNIHSVPVDTCGKPGLYSDTIIYSKNILQNISNLELMM